MIKEMLEYMGGYRATSIKKLTGREGSGWSAKILFNGEEIGEACDYGDGGAVRVHIENKQDESKLEAYAKTKTDYSFEQVEMFLDDVVNYELLLKKLKTESKKYLVLKPDDKIEKDENGIPMGFDKYNCADTPANRKAIEAKNVGVKFINDEIALADIVKVKKKVKP